jgi:hypothetical protein
MPQLVKEKLRKQKIQEQEKRLIKKKKLKQKQLLEVVNLLPRLQLRLLQNQKGAQNMNMIVTVELRKELKKVELAVIAGELRLKIWKQIMFLTRRKNQLRQQLLL